MSTKKCENSLKISKCACISDAVVMRHISSVLVETKCVSSRLKNVASRQLEAWREIYRHNENRDREVREFSNENSTTCSAVYGCLWISGCLWVFMGIYGGHRCLWLSWLFIGLCECLWVFIGVYRCLWVSMGVYRCLRESMGVYGFSGDPWWVSMGVYGCLLGFMGVYGCLWVYIGV